MIWIDSEHVHHEILDEPEGDHYVVMVDPRPTGWHDPYVRQPTIDGSPGLKVRFPTGVIARYYVIGCIESDIAIRNKRTAPRPS